MLMDEWSVREQLCLASVVTSNGEQNWMPVSGTMKFLSKKSRPNDWFSPKNCAAQYSRLLEEAEISKPKKCNSGDSVSSPSPDCVENSIGNVVKRLTEERKQELKAEIKKEQEEYAKLYADIKALQSGNLDDDQLLQMYRDIEKEQEMQRVDEMRLENQLREREEKKKELQRNWRASNALHSASTSSDSLKSSTDTTAVDMDVEEIIGTGKVVLPTTTTTTTTNAQLHPIAPAPLLSSLLKTANVVGAANNAANPISARSAAPTITTLLTSGSIPNTNQPAIIPSHDEAIQLLARPLSGPPVDTVGPSQNLLSPSQSAPTLSMLLEKTKPPGGGTSENKTQDSRNSTKINETKSTEEADKEPIPMDIEEDVNIVKMKKNSESPIIETDDTDDPNEEQQLLEVFKNIGNIEELVIDDEEVDFLRGVDEEPPANVAGEEENEFVNKNTEEKTHIPAIGTTTNPTTMEIEKPSKEINSKPLTGKMETKSEIKTETKSETISSDDSNDNLPLSAVASLESTKERNTNADSNSNESDFLKDLEDTSNIKNETIQVDSNSEPATSGINKNEQFDDNAQEASNDRRTLTLEKVKQEEKEKIEISKEEEEEEVEEISKFSAPIKETTSTTSTSKDSMKSSESLDIKIGNETIEKVKEEEQEVVEEDIVEDGSDIQNTSDNKRLEESQVEDSSNQQEPEEIQAVDNNESLSISTKMQAPACVSVADTDDDSSTSTLGHKLPQRKSPHEIKTDDEMPNLPMPPMVTPIATARSSTLRKLRDRDRSESPMIDEETTIISNDYCITTTNQRLRRRYSSTPVIDSIPNSPASSDRDERELRTSKKTLLSIYNVLYNSKYSTLIQRILKQENLLTGKPSDICLRPMDFQTIKKNIESGLIRNAYELQRDILLMCQNALMISNIRSNNSNIVLAFQQECQSVREFMPNHCYEIPLNKTEKETKDLIKSNNTSIQNNVSRGRSGSRKSLRIS
uniref:Bromo domain-containing protein n=1 Tax=Glossina brevipalpis TaxID=37001 RepID=A0A1A9WMQ8_9MUSC